MPVGSGNATVDYYAIDKAANQEPNNTIALKYDNIAPTVTHSLNPAPNAAGWNAGDVTVRFSAKDDDKGSGVDPSSITPRHSPSPQWRRRCQTNGARSGSSR